MLRIFAYAALAAVLSGCALLRPQISGTEPPSQALLAKWQARVAQLAPVSSFTVSGRIASGAIGFKADLRWKQHKNGQFQMRIAGPFGARATVLEGNQYLVSVRNGQEASRTTTDPEAWLEEALGVRLPVTGLRWWALGLPAPDTHYDMLLDPQGRALRIIQNGWQLDYPDYRAAGRFDLPRRIEARSGDTRILVLADAWSKLPGAAPASNP